MVLQPLPPRPAVPGFSKLLEMDSGLCIVSSLPIIWARSCPYEPSCGADNQANKGVVAVGVGVGGGREICVTTSHLQSDPCNDPLWWFTYNKYERAVKIKAKQLESMAEFVRECLRERKGEGKNVVGQVLCGDLNVWGEDLEVTEKADGKETKVRVRESQECKLMMGALNKGREGEDVFKDR
jgi:hypothetical protein